VIGAQINQQEQCMSNITGYIRRLFQKTERIDCSATKEEMIDGKAFTYKQYSLNKTMNLIAADTINASIVDVQSNGNVDRFKVSEYVGKNMTVDTVTIFRSKEAFGMTDCIGAVFGKAK
jgi:hypothetical protein